MTSAIPRLVDFGQSPWYDNLTRAYATGGQKSVHECWLLPGELATLKRDLEAVIDPVEDSVLFVRLDPRLKPRTLGIARPPVDPAFFFVG